MKWHHYSEHQGTWQNEVVLCFHPADRTDPFLEHRIGQYHQAGKTVRLMPDSRTSKPSTKGRRHEIAA